MSLKLTDYDKKSLDIANNCYQLIQKLESSKNISLGQIQEIGKDFFAIQGLANNLPQQGMHQATVNHFFACAQDKVNQFFQQHTALISVQYNAGGNSLSIRGLEGNWKQGPSLDLKNHDQWSIRIPKPDDGCFLEFKIVRELPNNTIEWSPDIKGGNFKIYSGQNMDIKINGSFTSPNCYAISHLPQATAGSTPRSNSNLFVPEIPSGFQLLPQQVANTKAQQIQKIANEHGYVWFYDEKTNPLTSCFGNFHPCNIEFGGTCYSNSEAAFQAQKFIDQSTTFCVFGSLSGEDAVKKGQTQMTPNRQSIWHGQNQSTNKVSVMMNVLRAKFGQNPDLKECLIATGNSFLVEHLPSKRRDNFWSDGYDGKGENMLGICLMRLRGEFGGAGVVSRNTKYNQMLISTGASNNSNAVNNNNNNAYPPKVCLADGCTKPALQNFKFCGKKHGQEYTQLCGRCIVCHTEPKHSDKDMQGVITKTHQFCSKTCAHK